MDQRHFAENNSKNTDVEQQVINLGTLIISCGQLSQPRPKGVFSCPPTWSLMWGRTGEGQRPWERTWSKDWENLCCGSSCNPVKKALELFIYSDKRNTQNKDEHNVSSKSGFILWSLCYNNWFCSRKWAATRLIGHLTAKVVIKRRCPWKWSNESLQQLSTAAKNDEQFTNKLAKRGP